MAFILQVDENILSSTCTFVEYIPGELQWRDETGLHSETSYNVLYHNNQDIKDGQTWEGPDDVLLTTQKTPENPTNPPTGNEEPSIPEPGGDIPVMYKCTIHYFKDNIEDEDDKKLINYYWITRPSELLEFNYASEYSENGWVIESLFIQSIEGFELDRIDTVIDSNYWEQDTLIHVYYVTKQVEPIEPSQGKIATNEDIYNASKYIYGVNNKQCPTKKFILDNGYDVIKLNNEYQDNQCVVLDDMSFKRTIEFKFENKVNSWVDPFAIWFGVKSKQISTYKFANQISKDYTSEITIAADISVWGDYKDEYLYVGFWSDGWQGDGRIMTFIINNKSFSNEKEGFSAEIPTAIKVVDFLRYYYKDIKVHLSAN